MLKCEDSERDTVLEQMKYISPRILSLAVSALSAVPKPEMNDAVSIAKALLVTAHHPCIGELLCNVHNMRCYLYTK